MSGSALEPAITFLFSDIEGSTRRWEGDPEAMAKDLACHDALLLEAVIGAGGRIFSHTGDGMGAAFDTPGAAVAAAAAAQQALGQASWSADPPLRVRMGLHTGSAQYRADNYFGPTLNRTARLMAVGAGGQVLCSQATADLLTDHLPSDVGLIDLGEHRLADLARPERVFQVTHARLPSEFGPLRSLGAHRHNLPVALTPLMGRILELKELGDLLSTSRLVTVTGLGGAGKTRLALQAAADVVAGYRDGVWLVELASVRDGALVGHTVASALGIDTSGLGGSEAVTERLASHLTTKEALLLVDNCEHLMGPTADLIHTLLSRCSGVAVLATSRETLSLPGEVVWPVPPLSLPPPGVANPVDLITSDAVVLFCERARTARPDFELTAANSADVIRICRRLDGIPLALELAAARIRVLSVREVADRLDTSFELLTSGSRTASPRHQTLRATLDWSYDLLTPNEQAALRQLTVFPAGFQFDAAEAVIGSDALDLITGLVDRSLVVAADGEEASRYRLLEPVRQYGRQRLVDAGEEEAAGRRHRDFFLTLISGWEGQFNPPGRMKRISVDDDSFRAALEWSWDQGDAVASLWIVGALWRNWLLDGKPDAREWFERVVAGTRSLEHRARVGALCGLTAARVYEDPDQAKEVFEEAIGLADRLQDTPSTALMGLQASEEALGSGDTTRARGLLEQALAAFEGLGDQTGVGWCHDHLGWVAVGENDYEQARCEFERAAELARLQAHDEWLGAHALAALAPLAVLAGEPERGLHLADEAVAVARRIPTRFVLVMALARAAETALLASDVRRSGDLLEDLLRCLSILGTRRYLGDCLEMVALTQAARDRSESATEMLGASAACHAADGGASGVRLLAGEAQACRLRLEGALGTEGFSAHFRQGQELSADMAITRALDELQSS